MANLSVEGYNITYEGFYPLNKHFTSLSCLTKNSSSLFYDLDTILKRKSYSCLTEDIGMSNLNIFRALNRKGSEWPRAPAENVHIVQECTTKINPKFKKRDYGEGNAKTVENTFYRDCVCVASGICLKDNHNNDTESSDNQNSRRYVDKTELNKEDAKYTTYTTGQIKYEGRKSNKIDRQKLYTEPCPCDLTSFGCPCKAKTIMSESNTIKSMNKKATTTRYVKEVTKNISNKNVAHSAMEDKLTRMSGDGLTEKYAVDLTKNDASCILIMDAHEVSNKSHCQMTNLFRNGVRIIRVLPNKVRKKSPKRIHSLRCPNCNDVIEFEVSTEDEASLDAPPKVYRKSETAFNFMASSKERIQTKVEFSNECPHGCEMVPLCQLLPKANVNTASMKHTNACTKRSTPRLIRMTKACRHFPPCVVVPSCQRNYVLKNNCDIIPPCLHRPRCINLPLCIPFCKELQYDEATKNYVDNEEKMESCSIGGSKYIPVNHCRLIPQHVIPHTATFEPRTYYMNQSNLYSQIPPLNKKLSEIATKSCQYDNSHYTPPLPKSDDKENATEASKSVIYIRDVGCQFKNSCPLQKASLFQTRICYTSSASFDPASKRVDNLYTNPNALCENAFLDTNEKISKVAIYPPSSGDESLSTKHGVCDQRLAKSRPETKISPITTFCMLRNCEKGYLIPFKPKMGAFKGKCKNKFTVQQRKISRVLCNILPRK